MRTRAVEMDTEEKAGVAYFAWEERLILELDENHPSTATRVVEVIAEVWDAAGDVGRGTLWATATAELDMLSWREAKSLPRTLQLRPPDPPDRPSSKNVRLPPLRHRGAI